MKLYISINDNGLKVTKTMKESLIEFFKDKNFYGENRVDMKKGNYKKD